jgi:hypothetical protein
MPFVLEPEAGKTLEASYTGKAYISPLTGQTECVAFLQATIPGIGHTGSWTEGTAITKDSTGIKAGTAIATFVDKKYPGPGKPKHAAVYVGQDETGLKVLDQWADQGEVLPRTIRFKVTAATRIQNDGNRYSIIEAPAASSAK